MEVKHLKEALAAFAFAAAPIAYKRCDSGLINDTYFVDCGEGNTRYILQRVNTSVFTEPEKLMENVRGVCSHVAGKVAENGGDVLRMVRTIISTKDGKDYFRDSEGGFWRAFLEIPGVVSYEYSADPCIHYKSAVAFGRFFNQLSDYPAESLYETIPDFHNTEKRMADFKKAVEADFMDRAAEMKSEIEFALSKAPLCSFIKEGMESGAFRVCVTHNDTKLGNVLMDEKTGDGVCIIDLDNVMPGSVLYDFGDAVRCGASSAPEDETDLSLVNFELDFFEMYVRGFVEELKDSLTKEEILSLPMGAYLMTLETGIRFLGDYLNGDVYYQIKYPEHNRDRARNQLKLIADMDRKMPEMEKIVKKYI